jgi:hypothetical protein
LRFETPDAPFEEIQFGGLDRFLKPVQFFQPVAPRRARK